MKREKPKNLKQIDQSDFSPSDVIPPPGYINTIDNDGILRRRKIRSDSQQPKAKRPVSKENINLTFIEIYNFQKPKEIDIAEIIEAFRACFYHMSTKKPGPFVEAQFYQFLQNNIAYFPVYSIIEHFCKNYDYRAIPEPVGIPRLLLPLP
jgi:hypothetical protein